MQILLNIIFSHRHQCAAKAVGVAAEAEMLIVSQARVAKRIIDQKR